MDRIGDSARKGLDFLKTRATETIEVQRLSATLRQLEERRQQCLIDLGHRLIVSLETDDLRAEAFQDRVAEVHSLSEEIEKVKKEQEDIRRHLRQSLEELGSSSVDSVSPPQYETS